MLALAKWEERLVLAQALLALTSGGAKYWFLVLKVSLNEAGFRFNANQTKKRVGH